MLKINKKTFMLVIFIMFSCDKDGIQNVNHGFRITIIANGGTVQKSPDFGQYENGCVVNLIAKPNNGYYFKNWSGDTLGSIVKYDSIQLKMDNDKTIYAKFDAIIENKIIGTSWKQIDYPGDDKFLYFARTYVVVYGSDDGKTINNWHMMGISGLTDHSFQYAEIGLINDKTGFADTHLVNCQYQLVGDSLKLEFIYTIETITKKYSREYELLYK